MDIKSAKISQKFQTFANKEYKVYIPHFYTEEDRERASEIVNQLKGMTIREAQEFLSKVSEALIDAYTL